MNEVDEAKKEALNWIESDTERLSDFHLKIWNYAETAYREYKSSAAYIDLLEKEGFQVEKGSGEMPTAFLATWSQGQGPVLGTYAEYDAVPGNSQQPVPYKSPREGLHDWAPGHTDPHSSLGVASLAAILGTKRAMEVHGIEGELRFFGEPAEKVCGSKPAHAAKGYYEGADAYISYHPNPNNTVILDTHCGSYWSVVFTFECQEPEKWMDPSLLVSPDRPHTVPRCPGALDAVCLMYTTTKYTKESMFPHTGTWTLNEFILAAGQCTSDNLPPRFSQIQYSWRSPTLDIQEQIFSVLERNAQQAAVATGCTLSTRWVTKTRVGLPNHVMANLTYKNMALMGPPEYSEDARGFAREIQENLGITPMDDPFTEDNQKLTTPQEWESAQQQSLPPWQINFTSDDYVEYTWHAPTVRVHTSRPRLKSPEQGFSYPAWVVNAMGGVPDCINPGMFLASKTMACTMIDLFTNPDHLKKAWEEFNQRTGGGVGGDKWMSPLLPEDFDPPVDLRWPEYINTVRGEEWWIPTNNK